MPEISPALVWAIIGTSLVILEFLIPGTFVLFLGIGALVAGFATRFFEINLLWQIFVFVTTTFLSVLLGGTLVKNIFKPRVTVDPFVKDDYQGQVVPVVEDVLVMQLGGKVKFQGTLWDAISTDVRISRGDLVKILSRDNLVFTVAQIDKI